MRHACIAVAAMLAGFVAGCTNDPYYSGRYGYGYSPGYSYYSPSGYYRNTAYASNRYDRNWNGVPDWQERRQPRGWFGWW